MLNSLLKLTGICVCIVCMSVTVAVPGFDLRGGGGLCQRGRGGRKYHGVCEVFTVEVYVIFIMY